MPTRNSRTFQRLALILVSAVFAVQPAAAQYFEYDPDNPAHNKPFKEGEKAVIPLDTKDPGYNIWQTPRENLTEGREPGLIQIQRFPRRTGLYGHSLVLQAPPGADPGRPDRRRCGCGDIRRLYGYGWRLSRWFLGTAGNAGIAPAPSGWGAFSMDHMLTLVNPFKDLTIVDYGDAPNDMLSTERTMHAVRAFMKEVAGTKNKKGNNVFPIVIGGDHSLMYADVAGLADVYGKGNVGVIHFDAHYDASKRLFGHLISHGQPVYRLIEEGHVPGKNFIQVGLRGYYPDADSFEWMREQGFRYHTMAEVEKRGWGPVMEDIIKEANDARKISSSHLISTSWIRPICRPPERRKATA